ncbi:MAG TPA: hypothetical protein VGY75_07020 [Candidatus Udaeobacter sp.]|jgi:hypothetical protein|nr:hypothetical protein [Candidatus Udaeobacter sp.]
MLPSQVEAIDRNRPGNKDIAIAERAVQVNRPYLRRVLSFWLASVLICVVIVAPQVSGQSKGRKKKAGTSATAGGSPGEQSLTNIPLPIGHEAKGLVLPDFDGDGRLRGKFEAGTAHRIDQEHVGFQHLKITTYTPQSQPDLQIDMKTSVLDLKTRILSSQERTTIQRSDFNIAGDSVQFDTNSKTGRLSGNIKMVITDKSHLTGKPNTTE